MSGHHRIAGWLMAVLLLAGCGSAPAPEVRSEEPVFTADLMATGKSDCTLLRMDELTMLVDAADRDDLDAIRSLLESYGVERIDYLVISHYDKDHIGSAAELIRACPVGEVIGPDYEEPSEEYWSLGEACQETGTPWTRLTEDRSIETENGSLRLDPADRDYGDDNNNSLILTVTFRERRLLFLGDARKKRMEEFAAVAEESYDLIKLPHHGDSCKPLERLVEATEPLWAVEMISVFETVESDLLQSLQKADTELFLTKNGPVHVEWGTTGLTVVQIPLR